MFTDYEKHQIIQETDQVDLVSEYITLKKNGREYEGLCPFHDEKNPSFKINPSKSIMKCFGCGWHGDVINFTSDIEKIGFVDAFYKLKSRKAGQLIDFERKPKPILPPKKTAPQIVPAPIVPTLSEFNHYELGKPDKTYEYRTENNELYGYVCRWDGDKKNMRPLVYRGGKWQFGGFDNPRCLFGAWQLSDPNNANKTVVIVEGEKTAEFLINIISDKFIFIGFHGGANNVHHQNWAQLSGFKKFILIPDNDFSHVKKDGSEIPWHEQPGNRAMLQIAEQIKPFAELTEWVNAPEGSPCGWDFADSTESPDEILKYILSHRIAVPQPNQPVKLIQSKPKQVDDLPFYFLGFRKDGDLPKFVFYSRHSKTVVFLSASSITKQNILNLAPLDYWEAGFSTGKGLNVDMISQYLINRSFEVGVFQDKRVRGRGAWVDDGRTVLHVGDKLIVDGEVQYLSKFESSYIYEQGIPLDIVITDPLHKKTASELISLLKLLSWEKPINAYLLAGWCVLAPFCGALRWRPHIWITGSAGTGKSWVYKNIVRRVIGESAIAIQGKTTEPGLRGVLNNDALPLVFDDTEGENKNDQDRIASILQLMRAASSDDGGVIALGGAGGSRGSSHKIRTMAALASIVVQIKQQSDRRRITILGMRKSLDIDQAVAQFDNIQSTYFELINDDFVSGLHARTIKLLPVILQNVDIFAAAVTSIVKNKEDGDQLGPMLAGAYSLVSDTVVSLEYAKEFLSRFDLSDESTSDQSRDENRLIRMLLERVISVDGQFKREDRSIAELIQNVRAMHINETSLNFPVNDVSNITGEASNIALLRIGMRVDGEFLIISNTHEGIKKMLSDTAWAGGNHAKTLLRIEGAESVNTVRYAGAVRSNSVKVPIVVFVG